jgi:hypothetical protein
MFRGHTVEAQVRAEDRSARQARADGRIATEAAVTALRSAFQAHLRTRAPATALVSVLRTVVAEARRNDMPIADLLISIKTAWSSIPETRQGQRTGLRDDMLDEIVSLCIEQYFATGAGCDS